jgi:hypothetical protein
VEDPEDDPPLSRVIGIWRANLARKAKNFEQAERYVRQVLADCSIENDWYSYLSAKIEEAKLSFARRDLQSMNGTLSDLRLLLKGRRCRSIQHQLQMLERWVREEGQSEVLRLSTKAGHDTLAYADKRLTLTGQTIRERILLLLLRKRTISMESIANQIYSITYEPKRHDKRIHFQIHSVRSLLGEIGVPRAAIRFGKDGYRLTTPVEISGGTE